MFGSLIVLFIKFHCSFYFMFDLQWNLINKTNKEPNKRYQQKPSNEREEIKKNNSRKALKKIRVKGITCRWRARFWIELERNLLAVDSMGGTISPIAHNFQNRALRERKSLAKFSSKFQTTRSKAYKVFRK